MSDDKDEILRMRERMHDLNEVVQATILRHATIDANLGHLMEGFKEHREDSRTFMRVTTEELKKISEQTTKTNGRVTAHDRELADLKKTRRAESYDAKRSTDRPDVITVNIPAGAISAKNIGAVVVAIILGLITAWKAGLFS